MCPGRWLAIDTMWITIVSVLAVYNIRKGVDERGVPIEPKVEYTSGLIRYVVSSAACIYIAHNIPCTQATLSFSSAL